MTEQVTEAMRIAGFESEAFDKFRNKIKEWPLSCRESAELVEAIYKAMDEKRDRDPDLRITLKALYAIRDEAVETVNEPMHRCRGAIHHILTLVGDGLRHLNPEAMKEAAKIRTIAQMKAIANGAPIIWADEIITDDRQYRRAIRDCLVMMGEKL